MSWQPCASAESIVLVSVWLCAHSLGVPLPADTQYMASRRQRSKREGTFLESVCESLQSLAQEIAEVKLIAKKLQDSPRPPCMDYYADMENYALWNPWQTWCDLCVDVPFPFNVDSVSEPACTFIVDATSFNPQSKEVTIPCNTLLAY